MIEQLILNELNSYLVKYDEEDKKYFIETLETYCVALLKATIVTEVSKFVDEQRHEKLV